MQDIDDARTAHARRIVDAGLFEAEMLTKLLGAVLCQVFHIVLGAEVQTSGRAGLDAGGLESFGDPISAQGALEHLLGLGVELGNIKGTAADAVAAADAVLLLKIDNAVGVLHNGAISRTRRQTSGIGAVHALVFAHQQHQAAVFALVLVELDEVPVVPRGLRHGLVAVVEGGFAEGVAVPLQASYFACLAADASSGVNELADLLCPLHALARNRPGVAGDSDDFQCCLAHIYSLRLV